ncbi:Rgp1-domain-containing protein [Gymnopilus junonius]|uniref:Rgp1-domain-containing protein n=1 Tax=Gymnopilus junonius TaxID=109634 RepID=A0A9P5NXC4_GYMJU|nr:Rgp1-domain-containing protein [Gymnopilus junonius]
MTTMMDADSPVRVVVTPSQSSYFAGEPFSVTITFTNTRSPEAGPSTRPTPSSLGHKRGAHSVSSAPLARPPTSPGTPRSAAVVPPTPRSKPLVDELPRRKGLIGKSKPPAPQQQLTPSLPQNSENLPDLIEQRRKRQLAPKSLSVSISSYDLEDQLADGVTASSAPYSQRSFYQDSQHTLTTPYTPSPLARTDTLPANHPHARKQSILDGQLDSLSLDILSPTTSVPPSPYSPTSSSSTFSLALDPIVEATKSPYPSTPALGPPTIENAPHVSPFPPHLPETPTTAPLPSAGSSGPSNPVYAYPPPRHANQNQTHHYNNHRPTPIGLGQPSAPPRGYLQPPRSAFASTTSFSPSIASTTNNELILYSYAQLTGTIVITPIPGILPTPEQAQTLNNTRAALVRRSVLGGGSMDISSTLNSPNPASTSASVTASPNVVSPTSRARQRAASHSRSSSFSAGLLSILSSPTSLVSSISNPNASGTGSGRWRTSSSSLSINLASPLSGRFPNSTSSPSVLGLAGTAGNGAGEVDPEVPLPTFEIQPAMLGVDLSLAPGESRSYTYTIKVPENLPPTFKGKALKFSYEFVVGICRAGHSGTGGGPASADSISRVMKVPIRVYNHVAVGPSLKPYDLLWPVNRRQDAGMPGTEARVVELEVSQSLAQGKGKVTRIPSCNRFHSAFASTNTIESIRDYARSLLASLPDPEPDEEDKGKDETSTLASGSSSSSAGANARDSVKDKSGITAHLGRTAELRRIESERERAEEGGLSGCREAVEILTRNPKKASYDVNKDGVKVAVLTFPKSAYRLGETVVGVVELNERMSRARVLKLSATLESHETLPSSISPTSSARHLRRAHAESHSSFTLNTLRTTFSLDIPSDASPAFQIRVGTPPNSSTSNPSQPPAPTPGGLEWKVRLCLLVGIAAETSYTGAQGVRFKSLVRDGPRGEWGSSWRATSSNAPMEKPNLRAEAELAATKEKERGHQRRSSQILATPRIWSQYLVSSLLYGNLPQNAEREYHDGDVLDDDEDDAEIGYDANGVTGMKRARMGMEGEGYDGIIPDLAGGVGIGVDYAGGEDGWRDVKLETVECEVPVKVYPGNTAFKALDVVFDV